MSASISTVGFRVLPYRLYTGISPETSEAMSAPAVTFPAKPCSGENNATTESLSSSLNTISDGIPSLV